jgi:hypothetical protein
MFITILKSIIIYNIGDMITPKYTPTTTIVLECNKADTGVGAAIALTSHELNGHCALFVNITISNPRIINDELNPLSVLASTPSELLSIPFKSVAGRSHDTASRSPALKTSF